MDELTEFVDKNFPCWKDSKKPRTYVTCPVFSYRDNYIPTKGASNYIPELYDDMDPHHYTASVEEQVFNAFIRFGDYTNQPMFIFPNFKIKAVMKKYSPEKVKKNKPEKAAHGYETDLLILHRRFGIILVEVKSNIDDYNEAKEQLEKREKVFTSMLTKCIPCDNPKLQKCPIKKVIACPCQYEQQRPKEIKYEYIHLCKDHVNSFADFKNWWDSTFENKALDKTATAIELVYNNLVPKFIDKRTNMYYNLSKNRAIEIKNELHLQRTLQRQVENVLQQPISKIENAISAIQKAKTVIEKNAELKTAISHIQKAIEHIKQAVKKLKAIRRTRIVSTDKKSTLHKFWKYMTSEQSNVWNKEKQIIYGPYGSGKTVLIQCKAADLALKGENVLIILPTHLMISYKNFFSNHMHASSNVTINGISEETSSELRASIEREWSNIKENEKGAHGKIILVSFKIFKSNTDYKFIIKLAYTSHVFSDELLWPPNTPDNLPENLRKFFSFINLIDLEKDRFSPKKYYFWITPHAYIFLVCLLTNKYCKCKMAHSSHQLTLQLIELIIHNHLKSECALLMFYILHMTKPDDKIECIRRDFNILYHLIYDGYYIRSRSHTWNCLAVTTLSTIFRTTKNIHEFIIQKEWQDFCKYKLADEGNLNVLFYSVLESLLCSSHGHHINGPPVRIFSINKNFDEYGEKLCEYFIDSSTEVIQNEIERLLRKKCSIFEPKDIAVIIDTCSIRHTIIEQSLLKKLNDNSCKSARRYVFSSFEEAQDRENTVVICNSDNIASLEWPVVIHVKYFYCHNYELDSSGDLNFFESYHNMIASRCTMEYIIICCEGTEDAWPHNNSFQKFKLWLEESGTDNVKFDVGAFQRYLKL